MSLRKRIADSEWFNRSVEALIAGWIRTAYRTSEWRREGFEPMEALLAAREPVIVVVWHQRLALAPFLFDPSKGEICTLTSASRAGRMAGHIVERFGLGTLPMSSRARHVALTRKVLGQMRRGVSVGIAPDGPRGPARVSSMVPVAWARASGKRVFMVTYSARRVLALPTWDEMWLPVPWTTGVMLCREWDRTVPKVLEAEAAEAARLDLQDALDALTDDADRQCARIA